MKNRTHKLTNGHPSTKDAQSTATPPVICLQPARAEAALELTAASQSQPQPPPPGPQPSPSNSLLFPPINPTIGRTRNGKVARLPKVHRDMVNRMLFNNIPPATIVDALEELGYTVTRRNISNWKTRGGYRDWRLAQEHALQMRLRFDNLTELLRKENASELPEVGLQAAAIQLSQFFLSPAAADLFASDPLEYERRLAALGKVALQLKSLQKYRDDCARQVYETPERLRREALKETESVRETFCSEIPDDPDTPHTPHRNFLPVV